MEGELPWDLFFGNTKPEVIMQFDTGNALHGGGEALPFLQRYPGRAVTVHLKDYDAERQSFDPAVGDGSVPFREIFEVCESTGGTRWYIVEYEADAYAPLEGVEVCLRNLKAMGK
jgi:sugar phosphate isomerase/epimerase